MANVSQVEREVAELQRFVRKLGEKNDAGQYVVKFGVLFDDDEAANTFEAIVGTLKAAKRRKVIKFKGQMLLKGVHDNVPITLLQGNDDDDGGDNGGGDGDVDAADNEQSEVQAVDEQKPEEVINVITNDNDENDNNINNDNNNNNNYTEPVKETVIVSSPIDDDNKENMTQIAGRCIMAGCKCDIYIENPSKWSKGKCKTCNHPPTKHQKKWVKTADIEKEEESASNTTTPIVSKKKEEEIVEAEILDNLWGEEFTTKLGECVNNTFEYDGESILPAKYLLHYLKKRIGFNFSGQSQHRDALKYVFVEKFGWKSINKWGYNVRVL